MIPLFKVYMNKAVLKPIQEVLMSGMITQAGQVEKFEQQLKNYFTNYLILTTNSATSAEHLAYRLLKNNFEVAEKHDNAIGLTKWEGLNYGDEVLTTALTCTATNWPILANNLKIKWVDVDPNTCNIDLDDLRRKITPKTKIIQVVHWGGYPVNLDKLKEIQLECLNIYGFRPLIIEDCAHAFGSEYKGIKIGNHGNICSFSFQAIKHLTTGDGGALIVPYQDLYNRGKLLRWYGIDRETNSKQFRCEDDIKEWGYKFHMNDINATIGIHNFPFIEKDVLSKHRDNAKYYNDNLKDIEGVELLENNPDCNSAYWIYTMKVKDHAGFMRWMKECDIMVSRVHERNDKHSCVKEFKTMLPNLDKLVKEMICIPVGWWITKEQREYIIECIKKGW